jgi:hypothetical protein
MIRDGKRQAGVEGFFTSLAGNALRQHFGGSLVDDHGSALDGFPRQLISFV